MTFTRISPQRMTTWRIKGAKRTWLPSTRALTVPKYLSLLWPPLWSLPLGQAPPLASHTLPQSQRSPHLLLYPKIPLTNRLACLWRFSSWAPSDLALLAKFRWLVDAYPEIADLLIRVMKVMKHSLASLYDQHLVTKPRNSSNVQPRARWGATGVIPAPVRKSMLTLYAPTPPGTSTADFVFFFPFWADCIPQCSTLDDLMDVIDPLMAFVGLHISRDPVFLTKFARLGRLHITSTVRQSIKVPFRTYFP